MKYFNSTVVSFFEIYGYSVTQSSDLIKIKNKKHVPVTVYVLLMLIGIAGIVLGVMSAYKMLLLCILLVFIPLLKILNQGPSKLLIDFVKKTINNTSITDLEKFQFSASEQNAHATPFEKGTIEYTLDLEMVTNDGTVIQIATFINRVEKKVGSEQVLSAFNNIIEE